MVCLHKLTITFSTTTTTASTTATKQQHNNTTSQQQRDLKVFDVVKKCNGD
jgi:hypothetical protein